MTLGARVAVLVRPRRVFHGWWMALSGMAIMVYTTGISFHGFSAMFDPIVKEMGWSRAQVAIGPSLQSLESGVFSPVVGFLADRLGPRSVMIGGFILGGIGFIFLGQVHALWQFYAAFVLLGMGMGAASYIVVVTAVSQWFIRKRGKALGIALLGPGLAGVVTFAFVGLIAEVGWRQAAVVAGLGLWIIGIPLALVMRRRPEEYNLQPDGDPAPSAEGAAQGVATAAAPREGSFAVREALHTRTYWLYVAALGLQQIAITGLVVHHIPALKSYGLSLQMAGLMVLVFTVASLPARYFSGALADRFDKRAVFAGALALQLAGGLFFVIVSNVWMALLFEVVYGSGWGASNPARLSLQADYWGRNIFGSLMGLQMGAAAIGGLAAPVFIGWMFDVTGSYRLAFLAVGVPLSLAVLLVLGMKRPPVRSASTG